MEHYDVKRLALVLSVQAEIEGMKAANNQSPESQPYHEGHYQEKAEKLSKLAYAHNEQL